MPTTSNFGWTTPADTDLVKDGASAIRTLGNGIDTSFLDLKGGTTNQILAKNSNTDLDFKWVADGGKVLQVVTATYSTQTDSSSTTQVDTGLTASITPASTSNKVLILVFQNGLWKTAGDSANQMAVRLFRGATEIQQSNTLLYTGTASELATTLHTSYLDSPNTTSSTTYKTTFNNALAASLVRVQNGSTTSVIILMEIGA